jgi:hypothetical protein
MEMLDSREFLKSVGRRRNSQLLRTNLSVIRKGEEAARQRARRLLCCTGGMRGGPANFSLDQEQMDPKTLRGRARVLAPRDPVHLKLPALTMMSLSVDSVTIKCRIF